MKERKKKEKRIVNMCGHMWTSKKEQKHYRCCRAVGQMFKQTSNYLNLILDLKDMFCPKVVALLIAPGSPSNISFSFSVYLLSPSPSPQLYFLFFSLSSYLPPLLLIEDSTEDVVRLKHIKSPGHAFHLLLVLSHISLYVH